MISEIKITNSKSGPVSIDIEGTIGVPEAWQFEEPQGRVATYDKFKATLAEISRLRSPEIVVNIRSTGGDVGDALLIYDALCATGATVTTRSWGYVASAATIIAQCATEGRREISANALYLIHNSVTGCEGNASDLRQNGELLAQTDRRIAEIYASRSGRPVEEFTRLMAENNGNGKWLSPDEAIAAGLADKIIAHSEKGRKVKAITLNSADAERVRTEQNIELERLRRRITTLESDNRQAAAQPSRTKPKEDPSPTESRRSANENAYLRDAAGFSNN